MMIFIIHIMILCLLISKFLHSDLNFYQPITFCLEYQLVIKDWSINLTTFCFSLSRFISASFIKAIIGVTYRHYRYQIKIIFYNDPVNCHFHIGLSAILFFDLIYLFRQVNASTRPLSRVAATLVCAGPQRRLPASGRVPGIVL